MGAKQLISVLRYMKFYLIKYRNDAKLREIIFIPFSTALLILAAFLICIIPEGGVF